MIAVENLCVRSGTFELRGLSFAVETGQYAVLMGQSGCGKTTLLEAVCGLRAVTLGRVRLLGQDVTHLEPRARGIGYVPQDVALFPTKTVAEHLAFGPSLQGWPAVTIAERVEELATLLGISRLLGRYPRGLSGGEAQRVAL